MRVTCRAWCFLLLLVPSIPSASAAFQQPTAEELAMAADPANPNADALYLYREETVDDKLHVHTLYVRLKIFNDQAKRYADVEIPYEGRIVSITDVQGRTIHSDGSVAPFTGKPFERVLAKRGRQSYKAKIFTMPDVQPGSILEYRYNLRYEDHWVIAPQWYIQQPLPVRKAHYLFQPTPNLDRVDAKGGFAHVAYSQLLPKGAQIKPVWNTYVLDVENIPPEPAEEFLPPMRSLSYRVLFYYTGYDTAEKFWQGEGKEWSGRVDRFAAPAGKLADAARELTSGLATPEEKLQKIYAAVMKLDNTGFSRAHSDEENRAEGVKEVKTAQDVWELRRGSPNELALVFIAMARAAGLKAYAMQVTNRDENMFQSYYLSLGQLNDYVVIVPVGDKEMYFDPGQRYCGYGAVHWKHTMAGGLRQTDRGPQIAVTPGPSYRRTQIRRMADLTLEPDGGVRGVVRVFLSGDEALRWRQRALETDEAEIKKEFADELQGEAPAGVELKTHHFLNLDTYDDTMMVQVDVSGSMGTATARRIFLPASFFQASVKPLFTHVQRENPIDLLDPYLAQDTVVLHLPPGAKVESPPANVTIPLSPNAFYKTEVKVDGAQLSLVRTLALANTLYLAKEYPALKDFFDKVHANDQQPAILEAAAAEGGR